MTETKQTGHHPFGRVLLVLLTCLGLWALLAAPRMLRAAEASPEGLRRTVSLWTLRPAAWLSETTGLSAASGALEEALGHDPNEPPGGELDIDAELEAAGLPRLPADQPPPEPSNRDRRDTGEPQQRAAGNERPRNDPLRKPSTRYRLRIAVIGDSLANGVGDAVERATRSSLVHVLNLGRNATGLARADYFDWVDGMRKVSRRYTPDVVVVMLGSNDKQSVVFPGGRAVVSGDPDWGGSYRDRIDGFLAAAGSKTHVVWVGLPPVKDAGKSRIFRSFNDLYADSVENRRNSEYVGLWKAFSDTDGKYRPFGPGPHGDKVLLRAVDGAHFTIPGYDLIAQKITDLLRSEWRLDPRTLD
jgi:hypothetical protein